MVACKLERNKLRFLEFVAGWDVFSVTQVAEILEFLNLFVRQR